MGDVFENQDDISFEYRKPDEKAKHEQAKADGSGANSSQANGNQANGSGPNNSGANSNQANTSQANTSQAKGSRVKNKFAAIRFREIEDADEPEWLIDRALPSTGVGVIFGDTGSRKSFLAIDISLAIARGIPWNGRKTRQGAVFYVAGEASTGVLKRIKAYRLRYNIKDDIPFFLIPARADLGHKHEAIDKAGELPPA